MHSTASWQGVAPKVYTENTDVLRGSKRFLSEQCSFHPGCLFDIGDDTDTTQLYGDYNKPI